MICSAALFDCRRYDGTEPSAVADSHLLNRSIPIEKQPIPASDRLAYLIAIGFGAGLVPLAPGTVGAAEGVAIFLALVGLHLRQPSALFLLVLANVIVFVVGVWASSRACKMIGHEDPRQVVIDEVSGQLIALSPLAGSPSVAGVIVAFVLFRLFDIFKPYPIRKLERLHGGLGVMADDALAGIYAAVLIWLSHLVGLI